MQNEIQVFLEAVKSLCPELTEREIEEFSKKLSIITLERKDYFIRSGKIQKEVGFITKGLMRSFYMDMSGNEKTVRFYAENDYATHYTAFITQQPSKYSF